MDKQTYAVTVELTLIVTDSSPEDAESAVESIILDHDALSASSYTFADTVNLSE